MSIELTKTDFNAITRNDSNYINNKGAKYYTDGQYDKAVEYYRIAAAMGNVQAINNLGYCYLYGRSIEVNVSEAIAMFTIASARGNADAAYKLGDMYSRDKWGLRDPELSVYYYRMAASYIIDDEWEGRKSLVWESELQRYPSLCFALARELSPDGQMATNIEVSYQFLKHAELGYQKELENGAGFYRDVYANAMEMMKAPYYDLVREEYDRAFYKEYSDFGEDTEEDEW
ncbi:MAG: sel1 repeat family protein [Erysipelotrichaceae bacterium]|nr:sel1 repeat family protein [Erysipelotrichaceae bacterium]